ncbi:MAG: C2 family cysteine protease [Methanoregulaceae archaeon]|nr:C2 family cysteine protease [Methanoregulaceae archaeon]
MMMDGRQGSGNNLLTGNFGGNDCNIPLLTVDEWKDIGKPVYDNYTVRSYENPIQGCVNDCYFIAALVSVAWAANSKLNTHPNYRFYNVNNHAWDPAFSMTSLTLAVDNVAGAPNLVYARSGSGYIWPCLYEKAYAKWKDGAHSDNPDIKALLGGGGSGLHALLEICGGSWDNGRKTFTNLTTNPGVIPLVPGSTKTQYPTIAKTRDVSGLPGGLIRNHTYSVLRKLPDKYELRNPCGGAFVYVPKIDATNFDEWGYIK